MSRAINLIYNEIDQLLFEISIVDANEEVLQLSRSIIAKSHRNGNSERKDWFTNNFYRGNIPQNEPYRIILADLRNRLRSSRTYIIELLDNDASLSFDQFKLNDHDHVLPILHTQEILEPLLAIYRSLIECGDFLIANGNLKSTIRRIQCFGLCMVKLDVRQESTKHAKAMDCVTEYLGLGKYSSWEEDAKVDFLVKELTGKRPLIPWNYFRADNDAIAPDVRDVLETFKMISRLSSESFGAYVISMARSASDILLVELLQKEVCFSLF